MPGTSSRMYRNNYLIRNRGYYYNPTRTIYIKDKKENEKNEYFCFIITIFVIIILAVFMKDIDNNNKLIIENNFINNHSIPYNERIFTNMNYSCNLIYLDKCNHNNKADMNGIKICKFNHILNTKTMKSQDEDGNWNHINITYNNDKLSVIIKRKQYIVSINGILKPNVFSNIYTFNGRYYVLNGYNNVIYGNCVLE